MSTPKVMWITDSHGYFWHKGCPVDLHETGFDIWCWDILVGGEFLRGGPVCGDWLDAMRAAMQEVDTLDKTPTSMV